MAFTADDLAQLGAFIRDEVSKGVDNIRQEVADARTADRTAIVGTPDVPADAGPQYYVHLADGTVVQSHDSQSTHMDVDGTQVQVIGRYQMGA